jgi:hypothetical protein
MIDRPTRTERRGMKYRVVPGQIIVSDVYHAVERDNVHVFEIDLESKYPGACLTSTTDTTVSVSIPVGDNTLKTNQTTQAMTEVVFSDFDCLGHDWRVITDSARYTVCVWCCIVYRR